MRLWGQVTAVKGTAAGAVTTVTTLERRVGTAREGLIVPVAHTMHPSGSALNACTWENAHALCEPLFGTLSFLSAKMTLSCSTHTMHIPQLVHSWMHAHAECTCRMHMENAHALCEAQTLTMKLSASAVANACTWENACVV